MLGIKCISVAPLFKHGVLIEFSVYSVAHIVQFQKCYLEK